VRRGWSPPANHLEAPPLKDTLILERELQHTTRGAPWWPGERMQLQHMKHRLLYNQMSRPLVARRENAASTHEA